MDKVLQEFRIIETDEGFRIEIKGDKEELREFVMALDPRGWTHHGLHGLGRGLWGQRRGPFGWGPWAAWDDDDDPDADAALHGRRWGRGRRRGRRHGRGHGRGHGYHHHHDHDHEHHHHEPDDLEPDAD